MNDIFAVDGPLAKVISDYRPRGGQIAMARAISEGRGLQVLEAGTGIGKTFAYLAPILRDGMSAVISTGTRALQDQLFFRDIPFLTAALGRTSRAAMLKGRGNYLCRRNLAHPAQSQLFSGDGDWAKVLEFAARDEEGDIRGAKDIPARSPVWAAAVSTRETCPAQGCDFYEKCFLYRARARAREADIVVVNHSLFLADMRLREEEVAELLPSRDIVVFDEAHLLPSLAPSHFGESISAADIMRILAETDRRAARIPPPPAFSALCRRWRAAAGALMEASAHFPPTVAGREALSRAEWRNAADLLLRGMQNARDAAIDLAGGAESDSGEWFAGIAARVAAAVEKLQRWRIRAEGGEIPEDNSDSESESDSAETIPSVCWVRRGRDSFALHTAPVSGREIFRRAWQNCGDVVMTSATLSVGGGFANFIEETGMDDARAESWASPFDFAARALLYLPPQMPDPNDAGYTARVIEIALPLIRANGGRAFVVFSSLRAMDEGAALLRDSLGGEYEILKQGDAPNDELLRRFRETKNAVLAGSLSFWQGVDVKGGALSLVVADKIPFSPPGDPLLAARDEWRKKRGEDAFMRNQVPPAAILMKQVAGRLMRDFGDWGVFAACDPRLRKRGYGAIILNSLPPMRRTTDAETAADFLQTMRRRTK
ncbi:MAG: ATP-dependent DNA helicase [Gammaproteobacteria bacterium]